MWSLTKSCFLSNHHKTHRNVKETQPALPTQFLLSWNVPETLAGPLPIILLLTLISFPLSDLLCPQKEVLAFSNPHTSQLYLIYDVFILPGLQAISLSND